MKNNYFCRLISIIIAVLLVLSNFCSTIAFATDTTNSKKSDKYIYASLPYSNPNAYFWSDSNITMTSWPGSSMENLGNDLYRAKIPEGATYVIFNQHERDDIYSQTPDLSLPKGGYLYIYRYGVSDYCFVDYANRTITAVGNGSDGWLNNADWDPTDTSNQLTEIRDDVYTITYRNVPKSDSYDLKFSSNGNWDYSWGGNYYGSGVETDAVCFDPYAYGVSSASFGNIRFGVPYARADVTLTLDLTNFSFYTFNGAKYTITIEEVKDDKVRIFGDLNFDLPLESGTLYSRDVYINNGSYGFRVDEKGKTMCFGYEFTDNFSAIYSSSYTSETIMNATGGTYKFTYDINTNKLTVKKTSGTDPTETTMPATTKPVTTEPIETVPVTTKPVTTEPIETVPVTTKPVTTEPIETVPVTTKPVTTEPIETVPVTTKPVTTEPIETVPVTTKPVTTEPIETVPVTTMPVTTEPIETVPVTTTPVNTEPIETVPVTTIPVTTEPIPTPPDKKTLTVNATSNIFTSQSSTYDEHTKKLTVTYWLQTEKDLLNTQWELTYDPNILSVSTEKNTKYTISPCTTTNCVCTFKDGIIKYNTYNLNLFDTAGKEIPFVQIVFDVNDISELSVNETTINLNVLYLTLSSINDSTGITDENEEVRVVYDSVINDTDGLITSERIEFDASTIPYLIGDIDGSNTIDIHDATILAKYLASYITISEENLLVADCDGDGRVSIKDVTYIQLYIAGAVNCGNTGQEYIP